MSDAEEKKLETFLQELSEQISEEVFEQLPAGPFRKLQGYEPLTILDSEIVEVLPHEGPQSEHQEEIRISPPHSWEAGQSDRIYLCYTAAPPPHLKKNPFIENIFLASFDYTKKSKMQVGTFNPEEGLKRWEPEPIFGPISVFAPPAEEPDPGSQESEEPVSPPGTTSTFDGHLGNETPSLPRQVLDWIFGTVPETDLLESDE